jgi:hypothetical protein
LYSKGKNFKLTTLVILNLNKPLKLKGRSFNKEKAVQPIASFGEAIKMKVSLYLIVKLVL